MSRILARRLKRLKILFPILFIGLGTFAVIMYGRGYRPNLKDNTLRTTGLLSAVSDPKGAQVYVDGVLKTATDNTINIDPNWYTVKITKEGFLPWEKRLRVQGEIVSQADAFLFPANPSLSPLTVTGIMSPVLSPDGTRIAYVIPQENTNADAGKAGLWVYELVERPLGFNRDPRQLGISASALNFDTAELMWSPDSTQLMVDSGSVVRLYNVNRTGDFQLVTTTQNSILKDWEEEKALKERQRLAAFKKEIIDMATSSARIISFSPDESKMLYEATASATIPQVINPPLIGSNPTDEQRTIEPGKLYVYDSREDKNFWVMDRSELISHTAPSSPAPTPRPTPRTRQPSSPPIGIWNLEFGISGTEVPVYWFPTNRHLVLTLNGKIDIMEYDRTNWVTVYAGPFSEGFLGIWPNTSKIIVLTNLNPGVSSLPNLYTVNLR